MGNLQCRAAVDQTLFVIPARMMAKRLYPPSFAALFMIFFP